MGSLSIQFNAQEFGHLVRLLGQQPIQDQASAGLYTKFAQAGAEFESQRNADADEAASLRLALKEKEAGHVPSK